MVVSTKDGYGFIRCANREARLFFHFSELLDTGAGDGGGEEKTTFRTNDELEFTVIPDPAQPSRMVAIRIRRLHRGAVKFETVLPERMTGHIEKEPALYSNMKSPGESRHIERVNAISNAMGSAVNLWHLKIHGTRLMSSV